MSKKLSRRELLSRTVGLGLFVMAVSGTAHPKQTTSPSKPPKSDAPQSKQKESPQAQRKDAVAEKVKQIVVEQLGVDEGEVVPNARFVEDLGADSLDTVELIMAFEEAFDIEIPDEDCRKLATVKGAIDYVKAHIKPHGQPRKPPAPASK